MTSDINHTHFFLLFKYRHRQIIPVVEQIPTQIIMSLCISIRYTSMSHLYDLHRHAFWYTGFRYGPQTSSLGTHWLQRRTTAWIQRTNTPLNFSAHINTNVLISFHNFHRILPGKLISRWINSPIVCVRVCVSMYNTHLWLQASEDCVGECREGRMSYSSLTCTPLEKGWTQEKEENYKHKETAESLMLAELDELK